MSESAWHAAPSPPRISSDNEGLRSRAKSLAQVGEDAKNKHLKPRSALRKRESWVLTWPLEVFSAILSILCVVCMIGLLKKLDGKPYTPWRLFNAHITPNSLLSILATLAKSSLLLAVAEGLGQLKWTYFQRRARRLFDLQLFDEASRGPFGALKLLWAVNVRDTVASVGAVITLLALAVDPFTQQILSFPTKTSLLNNATASINTLKYLGAPPGQDYSHSAFQQLVTAVGNGVISGLLNHYNPTTFSRSGASCTWPPYKTLGICSRCSDVSHKLVIECKPQEYDGFGIHHKFCTYTFPNVDLSPDLVLQQVVERIVVWDHADPPLPFTFPTPLMDIQPFPQPEQGMNATPILTVRSLKFFSHPVWTQETTWDTLEDSIIPVAHWCRLTWCERTHLATTCNAGILHEEPNSTTDVAFPVDRRFWGMGGRMAAGWPVDKPEPSSYHLNASNWETADEVYWVFSDIDLVLMNSLRHTLVTRLKDLGRSLDTSDWSPLNLRLYYTDLPQLLEDVATSVTNTLRQVGLPSLVQGKVYQPITHVDVNWLWLLHPAAMVAFATIFLGLSIAFSTEHNGVVWKSSLLRLLLYDLKDYEHQGDAIRLKELESEARKLQVSLTTEQDHQGVGLRYVPDEAG